jgi:anthranilate phosphoribosyltransferase
MVAEVLSKVGHERALVPIGYGESEGIRIDELSTLGKSVVSELHLNGRIETYEVYPEDLGVKHSNPNDVKAKDTHEENAKIALRVLSGKDRGARRDLILINAGAMLYLADEAKDLKDGYELACNVVDSVDVTKKVEELVVMSGGDLNRYKSLLTTL